MTSQPAQQPRHTVGTVLFGAWAAVASAAAMAGAPAEVVERLHERLLEVMQGAEPLGYVGRAERLRPVIESAYDLPFVTAAVMGEAWGTLTAAQRQEAVRVFSDLTVATYAARFDGYDGERFATGAERELPRGRMHLRTTLVKAGGDGVQLDYVLHEVDGDYRIINVVADGVSDLALKRAEYAAVIEGEGFDGLVARLLRQTAALAGESR